MAIRFIDLGRSGEPESPRKFGFWDDEYSCLISFHPRCAWESWDDFEHARQQVLRSYNQAPLEDFRNICPAWVFNPDAPPEPPGDLPSLLRQLSDIAEESGHSAIANAARLWAEQTAMPPFLIAPRPISDDESIRLREEWTNRFTGENRGRASIVGPSVTYDLLNATGQIQIIDDEK